MNMRLAVSLFALLLVSAMRSPAGPCTYSFSPTSASFGYSGGSGSFTVTVGSSCSWTAASTNSWVHPVGATTGNGTVNYTVDSNPNASSRVGAITVGNKNFTINQAMSLPGALDSTNLVW